MYAAKKDAFLNKYTRQISAEEAPQLFACLERLQKQANHPNAVFHRVYMLKDEACAAEPMLNYLAGCMRHGEENVLVLGKGMRSLFGHTELTSEISKELEAVIGHELGHVRYGDMKTLGRANLSFMSPLAGMMAAIGGIALARHLLQSHPDDPEKQKEVISQQQSAAKQTNGSVHAILTAGLYIAGAALGLWAGVQGGKVLRHGMEYRADRFSAELLGTGEPMARVLNTFRTLGTQQTEELMESLGHNRSKAEEAGNFLTRWFHPPLKERIRKMETFKC